jgi:hypothetical protein
MVSKTDMGVDQEDVDVSMNRKVLVAIVQQQPLDTESLKSNLSIYKSIFSDQDGDALASLSHQKGFVSRFFW